MKRSEVDAFRPYLSRALEGWIAKALPEDFFADFVRDPEGFIDDPSNEVFKNGLKTKVVQKRLVGSHATRTVVIKRFRYTGLLRRLAFFLSASPAVRSFRSALLLKQNGFLIAEPLAVFECRQWRTRGTSYYIADAVEGGCSLREFWRGGASARDRLKFGPSIIRGLAELFARLHRAGIYHRDLKGSNILMRDWRSGRPLFFLVDLDVKRVRMISPRRKFKNLLQLRLSWSARARAYFYLRYAKLCRPSRIEAKMLARQALALHRARAKAGTHDSKLLMG